MKHLFFFFVCIAVFACNKTRSGCDKWIAVYYQDTADGKTITSHYFPYKEEITLCGEGRDSVYDGKRVTLSRSGDLYNYLTYGRKY